MLVKQGTEALGQPRTLRHGRQRLCQRPDQPRAAVDQAGVKLHQIRAVAALFFGLCRGADPAGAEDDEAVVGLLPDVGEHAVGLVEQRLAGQTAALRLRCTFETGGALDGRIGGDQAVDPALDGQIDDGRNVFVSEVGRYLEQDRGRRALSPRVEGEIEDPRQRVDRLVVAQAGCVGAGDVDHQIIGEVGKPADAEGEVPGHVLRGLVGAEVDPEQRRALFRPEPVEIAPDLVVTAGVEAVAIDHGSVGGQAKHPRARVAGLGQWGHGADFDGGEAKGG
ncbi:MAG: Uncharacterised protein [Rhodospirillaceae bacterium]|nr:MAG: Uncharacterised protein [Rhodospirillaceae bacterium]